MAAPISNAVVLNLTAGFSAHLCHSPAAGAIGWATERRDVPFGLFFFSYGSQLPEGCWFRNKSYQRTALDCRGGTALCCSCSPKASGMTLPLVLVVLDIYPLRRLGGGVGKWFGGGVRQVWVEKVPFFVAALVAGAVALMAQQRAGALVSTETHDLGGRIAQSLYGVTFYLTKTLLPTDLAPLYEIPVDAYLLHPRFILAGAIFPLLSVGFFALRHRWPAGFACWIIYLLLLLPVSGIAQSGLQLVADRYSYLSCMVWAILLAAALPRLWWSGNNGTLRPTSAALFIGVPLFVLFGLGVLTWKQTTIWHDSESLWSHALAVSPSGMANLHVGRFVAQRGDLAEAEKHLRRAVEFNAKNNVFQSNLALILARQGNLAEATKHFRRALEINPDDPATLNNMGITLAQQGELDEAIRHFQRSLEIKPNDASGHTNMANLLLDRGDVEGATEHLRVAIEIDPADADSHNTLAIISAKRGNFAEATEYLRRVVELKPGDAAAANNLAITLAKQGRFDEAAQAFRSGAPHRPQFRRSSCRAGAGAGHAEEARRGDAPLSRGAEDSQGAAESCRLCRHYAMSKVAPRAEKRSRAQKRRAAVEPKSELAPLSDTGWFWVIFTCAFLVRLFYLIEINSIPLFYHLAGDGRTYYEWGQKIAAGDWLGQGVFYQAPLYPYFLGFLQTIFGHNLWLIRLIQIALGAISCALIFAAGRNLFSRRAGIAAGLILACYGPGVFFDGLIEKSILDFFLLSILLWLLSQLAATAPWSRWLALGAVLGLLGLSRENALILAVVVPIWIGLYFSESRHLESLTMDRTFLCRSGCGAPAGRTSKFGRGRRVQTHDGTVGAQFFHRQ